MGDSHPLTLTFRCKKWQPNGRRSAAGAYQGNQPTGFCSLEIVNAGLILTGIPLYVADGKRLFHLPGRKDGAGQWHNVVEPTSGLAWKEFQRAANQAMTEYFQQHPAQAQ